ncbi:MAG: PfkB family carbohydrate kinase [Myxococcota bacterium]|nr:PfkB family carbohydrate kinase [Myxococcota bacterium]
MARLDARRLAALVDRFARLRLLVVGDVMLDEYLWGEVDRVSPEAPVPVVHVRRESMALGGAGNVVRNVVAMGAQCRLAAVVGEDAAGDRVVDLLKDLGVDPSGIVRDAERPTTRKTRVEARGQQMLRFDRETDLPLSAATTRRLLASLEAGAGDVDGVVLEDYGKGVLAPRPLRGAMRRLVAREAWVAVDPKGAVAPYRGASLFKPNLREVELLAGIRVRDVADLARAVGRLRRKLGDGAEIVVTRGAEGMSIFRVGSEPVHVPIARSEVFDVQGAGDTSIAALALARRAGASLLEAVVIANAAAGVVVGKVGTATATPDEIRALLPAAVEAARGAGRSR